MTNEKWQHEREKKNDLFYRVHTIGAMVLVVCAGVIWGLGQLNQTLATSGDVTYECRAEFVRVNSEGLWCDGELNRY
jgi:hypothetical protein